MTTAEYLIEKYGLTLTIPQLGEVIHMKYGSICNLISADRFPIPTYKLTGTRVADARAVADYLDSQYEQSVANQCNHQYPQRALESP